jgi:hypothetical protein
MSGIWPLNIFALVGVVPAVHRNARSGSRATLTAVEAAECCSWFFNFKCQPWRTQFEVHRLINSMERNASAEVNSRSGRKSLISWASRSSRFVVVFTRWIQSFSQPIPMKPFKWSSGFQAKYCKFLFSKIYRRVVPWESANLLVEHVASICRV